MTTNLTSFGQATGGLFLSCNSPTLNVLGNTNATYIASCGYARSLTFTYGTGAGTLATTYKVDTMANFVRQLAISGTDTLTISALVGTSTSGTTTTAMTDVLGQATPVFARVAGILFELLTSGPPADTVGASDPAATAASSITIGSAASHAWLQIVDASSTFTLLNAESWAKVSRAAAGMVVAVGVTDQIKVLNNDGALVAVYRGVIFGAGT